MTGKLEHRQIFAAMTALSEGKIVNLEAPIRSLVNPIEESLLKTGGGEAGFHVLCCDEYFLVTELQGGGIREVERLADSIRSAITQTQKT